ncbi:hypothetical protein ZWY2020_004440 [Hordeum vulgare]|nr:hypothetical protein ZWY2020_004440 [Hordeum vulgare]
MGLKLLRLAATLLSPGASGADAQSAVLRATAHHPSTAPLYAHHLDALLAFSRGARGGVHGPRSCSPAAPSSSATSSSSPSSATRPPAATRSRSPPSRWAAPSSRPPGSGSPRACSRSSSSCRTPPATPSTSPRSPTRTSSPSSPPSPPSPWPPRAAPSRPSRGTGALKYFVPALEWVPHYNLDKFKFDILSGLTIASLASPRHRASSRRSTDLLLHPKRRDSGDGGSRPDGVAVRDWMVLQMQSLKLCSNLYRCLEEQLNIYVCFIRCVVPSAGLRSCVFCSGKAARGCTLDDNLPSLILHPKQRDSGDGGSRLDGVAVR